MIREIAIIGAGGIGQRHAQSCATMPVTEYHLHIVELDDQSRARASGLLEGREAVTWYSRIGELPKAIDLAIVATRADVRAGIIEALMKNTSARSLILEKVLFQKLADYAAVGRLLSQAGAVAWVNCPRRLWSAYRQLRDRLEGQKISRIKMSGAGWDIGCNAIHYLDLIAFLTGADRVAVDDITLGDVQPAKRSGMLHVEGEVTGHLMQGNRRVSFEIVSIPTHRGPQTLCIDIPQGGIEVTESASSIAISWPDGTLATDSIPLQSQITAPTVQSVFASGSCALTAYEESRALHESFVAALLAALARAGKLADHEICPIT